MPKISIIIPVYNVEKFLRRCLDSVLAQTFQDWEAVCINDGSPDNSIDILNEYASRDSRFKVISQVNGGLSDARNAGLKNATGDYIIYLDSDDSIHPQTMELSIALAQKNGSDIVSWYKDRMYRPQLLVRQKLGFDINHAVPRGMRKKYKLSNIKSFTTDDIFAHITENSHSGIKFPIKHFYAWRHLIRREFLSGLEFIKGITFEDFPWWSAVVLRHPRATITSLPFYYYFPNLGSIDMGSAEIKKVRNWIIGLESSYNLYTEKATTREIKIWEKQMMWPVIVFQIFRKIKKIENPNDKNDVRRVFARFEKSGMFDNPPSFLYKKYKNKILRFINE